MDLNHDKQYSRIFDPLIHGIESIIIRQPNNASPSYTRSNNLPIEGDSHLICPFCKQNNFDHKLYFTIFNECIPPFSEPSIKDSCNILMNALEKHIKLCTVNYSSDLTQAVNFIEQQCYNLILFIINYDFTSENDASTFAATWQGLWKRLFMNKSLDSIPNIAWLQLLVFQVTFTITYRCFYQYSSNSLLEWLLNELISFQYQNHYLPNSVEINQWNTNDSHSSNIFGRMLSHTNIYDTQKIPQQRLRITYIRQTFQWTHFLLFIYPLDESPWDRFYNKTLSSLNSSEIKYIKQFVSIESRKETQTFSQLLANEFSLSYFIFLTSITNSNMLFSPHLEYVFKRFYDISKPSQSTESSNNNQKEDGFLVKKATFDNSIVLWKSWNWVGEIIQDSIALIKASSIDKWSEYGSFLQYIFQSLMHLTKLWKSSSSSIIKSLSSFFCGELSSIPKRKKYYDSSNPLIWDYQSQENESSENVFSLFLNIIRQSLSQTFLEPKTIRFLNQSILSSLLTTINLLSEKKIDEVSEQNIVYNMVFFYSTLWPFLDKQQIENLCKNILSQIPFASLSGKARMEFLEGFFGLFYRLTILDTKHNISHHSVVPLGSLLIKFLDSQIDLIMTLHAALLNEKNEKISSSAIRNNHTFVFPKSSKSNDQVLFKMPKRTEHQDDSSSVSTNVSLEQKIEFENALLVKFLKDIQNFFSFGITNKNQLNEPKPDKNGNHLLYSLILIDSKFLFKIISNSKLTIYSSLLDVIENLLSSILGIIFSNITHPSISSYLQQTLQKLCKQLLLGFPTYTNPSNQSDGGQNSTFHPTQYVQAVLVGSLIPVFFPLPFQQNNHEKSTVEQDSKSLLTAFIPSHTSIDQNLSGDIKVSQIVLGKNIEGLQPFYFRKSPHQRLLAGAICTGWLQMMTQLYDSNIPIISLFNSDCLISLLTVCFDTLLENNPSFCLEFFQSVYRFSNVLHLIEIEKSQKRQLWDMNIQCASILHKIIHPLAKWCLSPIRSLENQVQLSRVFFMNFSTEANNLRLNTSSSTSSSSYKNGEKSLCIQDMVHCLDHFIPIMEQSYRESTTLTIHTNLTELYYPIVSSILLHCSSMIHVKNSASEHLFGHLANKFIIKPILEVVEHLGASSNSQPLEKKPKSIEPKSPYNIVSMSSNPVVVSASTVAANQLSPSELLIKFKTHTEPRLCEIIQTYVFSLSMLNLQQDLFLQRQMSNIFCSVVHFICCGGDQKLMDALCSGLLLPSILFTGSNIRYTLSPTAILLYLYQGAPNVANMSIVSPNLFASSRLVRLNSLLELQDFVFANILPWIMNWCSLKSNKSTGINNNQTSPSNHQTLLDSSSKLAIYMALTNFCAFFAIKQHFIIANANQMKIILEHHKSQQRQQNELSANPNYENENNVELSHNMTNSDLIQLEKELADYPKKSFLSQISSFNLVIHYILDYTNTLLPTANAYGKFTIFRQLKVILKKMINPLFPHFLHTPQILSPNGGSSNNAEFYLSVENKLMYDNLIGAFKRLILSILSDLNYIFNQNWSQTNNEASERTTLRHNKLNKLFQDNIAKESPNLSTYSITIPSQPHLALLISKQFEIILIMLNLGGSFIVNPLFSSFNNLFDSLFVLSDINSTTTYQKYNPENYILVSKNKRLERPDIAPSLQTFKKEMINLRSILEK